MATFFGTRPVLRSMAAYAVMYPSANLVQQKYIRCKESLDWTEASRFLIYGTGFHAPLVHYWLQFASKRIPQANPRQLVAKVIFEQIVFSPFALSCFYIGITALERKSASEIYEEWRKKFPKTYMINVCIWPFIQAFNFTYVPINNRAIFVGCAAFFWTTLLSYWKSEHEEKSSIS